MNNRTLVALSCLTLLACIFTTQANAQVAAPAPIAQVFPAYATNALFVDDTGDPEVPVYLVTNLQVVQVLGKDVVFGNLWEWQTWDDHSAIAFVPSDDPLAFWFVSPGFVGLVEFLPDEIRWTDTQGNSGYIIVF